MNKKETLARARRLAMAITQEEGGTSKSMQKGSYEKEFYGLDQDGLDVVDSALNAAKAMGADTEAEAIVAICEAFSKAV